MNKEQIIKELYELLNIAHRNETEKQQEALQEAIEIIRKSEIE